MARTKTTTYGGGNKRRRLNPSPESSNATEIRRDRNNSGGSSSSSSSSSSYSSSSRSGAPSSLPSSSRSDAPPSLPSSSRGGFSRYTTDEDMRQAAYKTIMKELDLVNDAGSGDFTAGPVGDDLHLYEAHVTGPADSPYAEANFFLSIRFSPEYPMRPPKVFFKVKNFFHPNISETDRIGLQILENQTWTPLFRIDKILEAIVELLRRPRIEPEYIVLQPELGKMYKEDYGLYMASAQSWTEVYIRSMN